MKRQDWYKSVLVLTCITVFVYVLNYFAPIIWGDDMLYAYRWKSGVPFHEQGFYPMPRISDWGGLFQSLYEHYKEWHGRLPAQFFNYVFMWAGKPVFNVCNTVMTVLLVVLVARCSDRKDRFDWKRLFLIFFGFWYFTFCFPSVFLWISGSCNYLWAAVYTVFFLGIYIRWYVHPPVRESVWIHIGMFVSGWFAGCTNENSVPAVFVFLFLLVWKERELLRYRPAWTGVIGLSVGYLMLMGSILVSNRMYKNFEYMQGIMEKLPDGVVYKEWVDTVWNGIQHHEFLPWINTGTIINNGSSLLIYLLAYSSLFLIIFAGICYTRKDGSPKRTHLMVSLVVGSMVVAGLLLFYPYVPSRAFFMTFIFLLIGVVAVIDAGLELYGKRMEQGLLAVVCLAMVYLVVTSWETVLFGQKYKNMEEQFDSVAKNHPECSIEVEAPSYRWLEKRNKWMIPFYMNGSTQDDKYILSTVKRYYGLKDLKATFHYDCNYPLKVWVVDK